VTGPQQLKGVPALVCHLLPPASWKTSATAEAEIKKGHFYKPLPKEFRHDEFTYRQIYREGDFAIYTQTWKGNEDSAAFELIRIRRRDAFEIEGRFVEPSEFYPSSKEWGAHGWTFPDRNSAFRKLREIVSSRNAPARSRQRRADRVEKSPT